MKWPDGIIWHVVFGIQTLVNPKPEDHVRDEIGDSNTFIVLTETEVISQFDTSEVAS